MTLFWVGQIVGVAAMIESFFIYQFQDRRKMVLMKMIDDFLWAIHFVMIGGYTAAVSSIIAFFREIVFYNKGNKAWASSKWWLLGFAAVAIALAPLTWQNMFSILPVISSLVSIYIFWTNKTDIAKLVQILASLSMLIYSIIYHSYSGIVAQTISIFSISVYFTRKMCKK